MPTWLVIVLIVLAALLLLVLAGGALGAQRRSRAQAARLLRDVAQANEHLAIARAQDRGWDRDTIDAAARAAHAQRRPHARVSAVHLVQVIDRPGTDDDEARVHVVDDAGEHEILLRRRGDDWLPAEDSTST
ncbi:MAG: hypothetical protein IRZ32_06765 [Solirubrobacteraceae bacterium]|nr:hypothetical protein [Solirubrobacteraceae bacterium]